MTTLRLIPVPAYLRLGAWRLFGLLFFTVFGLGPLAFGWPTFRFECRREAAGVRCEQRRGVAAGLIEWTETLADVRSMRWEPPAARRSLRLHLEGPGGALIVRTSPRDASVIERGVQALLDDEHAPPLTFSTSDGVWFALIFGALFSLALPFALWGNLLWWFNLFFPAFVAIDRERRRLVFRPRAGRPGTVELPLGALATVVVSRSFEDRPTWPGADDAQPASSERLSGVIHLRFNLQDGRSLGLRTDGSSRAAEVKAWCDAVNAAVLSR